MRTAFVAAIILGLMATPTLAGTVTFDEPGLVHGTILDTELQSAHGLTVSAKNIGGGPDIAAVFDSTRTGTRDPDLEDPWDGGNIVTHYGGMNTVLGNLVIIQENRIDDNNDGILDHPDDEGSRPAGSLYFDFDRQLTSIGWDFVDIEGVASGQENGYVITAKSGGSTVGSVSFADLINPASIHYDGTIAYGNNTANRIKPISFGGVTFDRVEFKLGGSGAVTNLTYVVPLPSAAWMGLGLIGFIGAVRLVRRRRRMAM